jgi:hypothetical protein
LEVGETLLKVWSDDSLSTFSEVEKTKSNPFEVDDRADFSKFPYTAGSRDYPRLWYLENLKTRKP